MKTLKMIAILFFAFALNSQVNASITEINKEKKTAESVWAFANNMETFDSDALESEMMQLSISEKVKLVKMSLKDVKNAEVAGGTSASIGLYILAILIPPVAVAIHTNLGMPTVYNILWTLLGYIPGIIHAFIVLGR